MRQRVFVFSVSSMAVSVGGEHGVGRCSIDLVLSLRITASVCMWLYCRHEMLMRCTYQRDLKTRKDTSL